MTEAYNLNEFKGVIVPDGYENEGLTEVDGYYFCSVCGYVQQKEEACINHCDPLEMDAIDDHKQITLTLARQLQGCLIMAWTSGAKSVEVVHYHSGNYSEVKWLNSWNISYRVMLPNDPFRIVENEGKGKTITIQRPQGVYE